MATANDGDDAVAECQRTLDAFLRERTKATTNDDDPAGGAEGGSRRPFDADDVAAALDRLAAVDVHLRMLKETGIGATVAKLRRLLSENNADYPEGLLRRADELVKCWKSLAREEIRTGDANHAARRRTRSLCTSQLQVNAGGDDSSDETASRKSGYSVRSADTAAALISPHARTSAESNGGGADDEFRRKFGQLIADALRTGNAFDKLKKKAREPASLEHLGDDIETAVYLAHGQNCACPKYKARMRQILFNLKHKENDALRKCVMLGDISPEKLASMDADELAPARVRTLRKSFEQESLHEHTLPKADPAATEHSEMFKCHRCGERDTSYTLSQERMDGDYEPVAVTLVACNKCGNRWKSC